MYIKLEGEWKRYRENSKKAVLRDEEGVAYGG